VFCWLADLAELRHVRVIQVPVVNGRDNKVLSQLLRQMGAEVSEEEAGKQAGGIETTFQLEVSGFRNSLTRVAPNSEALAAIIKNMSHGEVPGAR
jgi:hypothetical protein